MTFPFWIHVGFIKLHPHAVFETLAYFVGFRVYLYTRNKEKLPVNQAFWILVGAILGAALGSKLLYWLEDPVKTLDNWRSFTYLMEGKTIVGGLLGGLIGVEWMKKRVGITRSTGDDMAIPIMVGMAIGRVGCFLTGLDDHTYGTPTTWFTGIDFGDGIYRHPTQLYEIVFLLLLSAFILVLKRRAVRSQAEENAAEQTVTDKLPDGAFFQLFMTGYLLFRFGIDFIKPTPHPYLGLNNIQLACVAGLIYYFYLLRQWLLIPRSLRKEDSHAYEK
jgi:phosphatidylglycerol:prolipoprotein diacylglycerol transferase